MSADIKLSLRKPAGASQMTKDAKARAELDKARAEIAKLRAENESAQVQAEQMRFKAAKSRRDAKNGLRIAAVIMMAAALVKVIYFETTAEPVVSAVQPLRGASSTTVTSSPKAGTLQEERLNKSLERLRTAFHSFPDEDQMDVVREINAKYPADKFACPLVWRDGQPHVLFSNNAQPDSPSVVAALNECASEVEKLRIQRDAARGENR